MYVPLCNKTRHKINASKPGVGNEFWDKEDRGEQRSAHVPRQVTLGATVLDDFGLAAQLRLPVSLLLTFPRSGDLYLSHPGADAHLVEVAEQARRILVDPIGSCPLQLVLPVSP
jgi:hypothetical protein